MGIKVCKPFCLSFKGVPTSLKIICDNVSGAFVLSESLNRLISLVWTKVDETLLDTMIWFYDPLLHCVTYRDFQLVPTLEEFSSILGLPVLDQMPYTGEEEIPKLKDVDAALHLPRSEIKKVWVNKGDYTGLPIDFIYSQAKILINATNVTVTKIFIDNNPVPTLLGDLLHSIHHRSSKGKGCVLGCAPLLHKWFISHLPRSVIKNEEGGTWVQRIMRLSYDDIVWNQKEFEGTHWFDSCGAFLNVLLLGTRGGITYNPILARHQFGFALKDKPRSIYLSAENFDYDSDTTRKKKLFIRAWSKVKKVCTRELGLRNYIPSDIYFRLIYDRVVEYGMPYPSDIPVVPRVTPPVIPVVLEPYVPAPNEDLGATVASLRREKADLEKRLREVEAEKIVLVADAKERYGMLDYFSRKWKIEDFVSPDQIQSWEQEIDRLVQERNEMIKAHKEEIRSLKRKRRLED
ncbi:uncharacterized protein LOC131627618 [Vicia villosa]|uniref:uncharacterized protein LOC131627618 n=1 Tax=Vicia villosa TaxID=3911 RepID=UPI00273B8D55|nr:uncharacterized protein LOC131627618 [Vicia villosa]